MTNPPDGRARVNMGPFKMVVQLRLDTYSKISLKIFSTRASTNSYPTGGTCDGTGKDETFYVLRSVSCVGQACLGSADCVGDGICTSSNTCDMNYECTYDSECPWIGTMCNEFGFCEYTYEF